MQHGARAQPPDDLEVQRRLGRGSTRDTAGRLARRVDLQNLAEAASAPLWAALAVIASRSGDRPTTTLKLPLVPNTHPRP